MEDLQEANQRLFQVTGPQHCLQLEEERKVKVVLIGNHGVGKTSIKRYLCGENFQENQGQSYGVNKDHVEITVRQKAYHICVTDTTGLDEGNIHLIRSHVTERHIPIWVYAIDDEESFNDLFKKGIDMLLEENVFSKSKLLFILGNKGDLHRSDIDQDRCKWTSPIDIKVYERANKIKIIQDTCSAKEGNTIDNFFTDVLEAVIKEKEEAEAEVKAKEASKWFQFQCTVA